MTRLTLAGARGRIVGLLCACVLVAGGCQAGSQGEPTDDLAGRVTTSSGSSQSIPVQMSGGYVIDEDGRPLQPERSWPALTRDPLVDEDSPEGVEAFARYFVAVAERARNTGNTEELENISSSTCTFCTNLVTMIGNDYANGRWLDGLQYRIVKDVSPVMFPDDDQRFAVILYLRSSGLAYYNGDSVVPVAMKNESLELHICRESHRWVTCEAIGGSDESN